MINLVLIDILTLITPACYMCALKRYCIKRFMRKRSRFFEVIIRTCRQIITTVTPVAFGIPESEQIKPKIRWFGYVQIPVFVTQCQNRSLSRRRKSYGYGQPAYDKNDEIT